MPAAAKVERINVGSGGDQQQPQQNSKIVANNSSNNNNVNAAQDPTKIANTIIEKKIRNLEKRKVNNHYI